VTWRDRLTGQGDTPFYPDRLMAESLTPSSEVIVALESFAG
jgi:hypothetical protein